MLRYSLAVFLSLCSAAHAAAGWADVMFDDLTRDFGSVPRGPTMSHTFRFTNKYNTPVHVSSVRVSCGCVSASAGTAEVQPGQTGTISANMDTSRFFGSKAVTIYVQFDRPQWEEVHLTVQANSRDDVSISPDSLSFGQVKRGKPSSSKVNVTFLGNGYTQITDLRSESNYVQPVLKELRRGDGEVVYEVAARLRPDLPVGKWYTDVWLRTNNPAAPQVRVPLTVEVEPLLTVSPAVAALPEVKAGESTERKILIRADKPFRITDLKGGDTQLTVSDLTKESKPLHVLLLTLKAAKPGDLKWNVHVKTDLPVDGELDFQAIARVSP